MSFVVAGIPAAAVVVAIVQGIKAGLGIEGKAAILVAVAVGVLVAVGAQAATLWPAFGVWWETVIAGVLLGLAACGLFDVGQAVKGEIVARLKA